MTLLHFFLSNNDPLFMFMGFELWVLVDILMHYLVHVIFLTMFLTGVMRDRIVCVKYLCKEGGFYKVENPSDEWNDVILEI